MSAHRVLPGKILRPKYMLQPESFDVTEDSFGTGLIFEFVDPVRKKIKKREYLESEDVLIEWDPHPGAAVYTVQVYRKPDAQSWKTEKIFHWKGLPRTVEPRFRFSDHDVKLLPGSYYVIDINAYDENDVTLSTTVKPNAGYDFMTKGHEQNQAELHPE